MESVFSQDEIVEIALIKVMLKRITPVIKIGV